MALIDLFKKYVAPKPKGVVPTQPAATVTNQQDAIGTGADPMAANKPSLFSSAAPGVGTNYTNTLNSALTGQMYDPMAAGAKEAQARSAANARASTAGQIANAGFAGTGIGTSIAGGTDNQLAKQKYDTMIGVEQARNEGRVGALGEARAYGAAEEGVRQYEQDFGQDKMVDQRNFDEDVRRYGQDFAEKKRWYDETTAEDKRQYGDTQNSQAYEAALVNGSDADVIAAYKAWTGKDLDPSAVATYRGYARTAANQRLAQGAIDLNSGVGKDLAAAITNFPDLQPTAASINDPANATVKAKLQAMWDTLPGKKGTPMDDNWAATQVKAVKDSSNTMIMANKAIDDAVTGGVYTPTEGATLKSMMADKGVLAAWVPDDPSNPSGPGHFDLAKLEIAKGLPAGSLGGTPAAVVKPTKPDGSAYAKGESYTDTTTGKVMLVGADGNATEATFDPEGSVADAFGSAASALLKADPTSDTGVAIATARANALISGKEPWTTLGNAGPGDPVYDRTLAIAQERYIGPSNDVKGFRKPPSVGEVVKIPDGKGGFTLAKMTRMWGDNTKRMEFTSVDGKTKYTASFPTGQKGAGTTWTNTPAK
jgi:hypothetical protein